MTSEVIDGYDPTGHRRAPRSVRTLVDMSTDTANPTAVDATVDAYLETWNETDPAKRAALIERSLGADLWYRDPLLEADGLDAYEAMIAAVQAQFPGLVMTRTSADRRPPRPRPLQLGARRAGRDAGVRRARRGQDRRRRQAAPHHRLRRRDDRLGSTGRTASEERRESDERRGHAAGLAGGPPAQPAGPGARRRGVDAAPQLRRDRQVEAVAGAGAGPRRAPRRPAPGAQLDAPRRRLRPAVPADVARRRGDGQRPQRPRRADPGPRPVPGGRRRSGVGRRDDEHRRPGLPRRRRRPPPPGTAELVPDHAAPRRHGAADPQLRRVGAATSSARSIARSRRRATPGCGSCSTR